MIFYQNETLFVFPVKRIHDDSSDDPAIFKLPLPYTYAFLYLDQLLIRVKNFCGNLFY